MTRFKLKDNQVHRNHRVNFFLQKYMNGSIKIFYTVLTKILLKIIPNNCVVQSFKSLFITLLIKRCKQKNAKHQHQITFSTL